MSFARKIRKSQPREPALAAFAQRLARLQPGYVGELASDGDVVCLTAAREDMDALARCGAANDAEGVLQLARSGRVRVLGAGTRCRVVEAPSLLNLPHGLYGTETYLWVVLVEVLGGPHDGERAWCGAEFLR